MDAPPLPATSSPVDAIRSTIAGLGDARLAMAGDTTALAHLLKGLQAVTRDIAILARDVEEDLHDSMDTFEVEVPGIGRLRRGRAAESEHYESEVLFRQVATRAVADPETGEVLLPGPALERAIATLASTLPITSSLGWRKRGLDAVIGTAWREAHHSKVPGRKTVRFM